MANVSRDLLLVASDGEIRDLLVEYLSRHGYRVQTTDPAANTAGMAVRPQLAVVDLGEAGEQAKLVVRSLREQSPRVGIIVITTPRPAVMIGPPMPGDLHEELSRPFELRELLSRLKHLSLRAAAA